MKPSDRRSFISSCAAGAVGAMASVARGASIWVDGMAFPSPYSETHTIVIPETPTLAVREVSVPGPKQAFELVTVEAVANARFALTATASAPTTASLFCQANAYSEFRTPNRPDGIVYGRVNNGAAGITLGGNNTTVTLNLNGVPNRSGLFRFDGTALNANQYFRNYYLVNGRFPFLFVAWSTFRLGAPSPWVLTSRRAWVTSTLRVTYHYYPVLQQ